MALSAHEVDTAFADLMCADPQWLAEEFDALIAASFGEPPSAPPPAPPCVPHGPGAPSHEPWSPLVARPVTAVWPAPRPGLGQPRSPPVPEPRWTQLLD
jgi:hypothetical protein